MKNLSSGSRAVPCGRTHRYDEANGRFSQFCEGEKTQDRELKRTGRKARNKEQKQGPDSRCSVYMRVRVCVCVCVYIYIVSRCSAHQKNQPPLVTCSGVDD